MESHISIDSTFISNWQPRYDECEDDEPEYQSLVAQIRYEINDTGTLSRHTFVRVLDWKSPRVKGIVKLDEYPGYAAAISEVVRAATGDKLRLLCQLHGIGAPVGSTLLHLMYPGQFPIVDIRTVETLHRAGLVESDKTDLARYPAFLSAIVRIAGASPGFSLREIDRALFAYHKLALSPERGRKRVSMRNDQEKRKVVPKQFIPNASVGASNHASQGKSTMGTRQKVRDTFTGKEGQVFSRDEIVTLVVDAFPGTNPRSVIPSDYCYNKINVDPSSFKLRGFEFTNEKKYRWLGPEYAYSGPIFWKAEIVGQWNNGRYILKKDPRSRSVA